MAGGLFQQIDEGLMNLLSGWNKYTTVAFLAVLVLTFYTLATSIDPDVHPLILSRQATAAAIRNEGESAYYRSPEIPHGYPLRTGLDVKDGGSKSWQAGRNGDLRDIWRRVTGELPIPPPSNSRGLTGPAAPALPKEGPPKFLTVMGTEKVIEHNVAELTKEIAVIGSFAKSHGQTVAIFMPNSTELLVALFACAFYGLDAILLPYSQAPTRASSTIALLRDLRADVLIARAGTLPIEEVAGQAKTLKQVIWYVEPTSRQVDWTEVPKHIGGRIEVDAWHDLVQNHADAGNSPTFPELTPEQLGRVTTVWEGNGGELATETFTQQNLVAAISAQVNALPPRLRLGPSDLFFPAAPLTSSHTLCATLAALFTHASLALNSAVLPGIDLATAARKVAATVILTTAETAEKLHTKGRIGIVGYMKTFSHSLATRTLEKGAFFAQANSPTAPAIGSQPGKLRLVIVVERAGVDTPPLTSADLNDLRVFTGSRVIYALTAKNVAGAVAQTSIFDYRNQGEKGQSHFGVPLSSVEVKVVDRADVVTNDEEARGEIVVRGPAVAGGETKLGVLGRFRNDATLAYV